MTEIFANQTVEVVKSAIETADGALDLYNKYLDQVIPWKTFDETIKELSRFKHEYSQAASVLVGDIKVLLMDSQDKYFEATQTVYEWCGVATQLLTAYILLFDEYNEKKASAQKDILIRILDDGVKKLNEAQKSLLVSSQSFNTASGKLLALDSQLTNSSGLVPCAPSKRVLKPYGCWLRAPLSVDTVPLPRLMSPSQCA